MAPIDRMILLHGIANVHGREVPLSLLIDSGCSKSVVYEEWAQQIGLPQREKRHATYAAIADGSLVRVRKEAILDFKIGAYPDRVEVNVIPGRSQNIDGLLGMDWLRRVDPKVSFRLLSLKVKDRNGKEHELTGHKPRGGRQGFCPKHGHQCPDGTRDNGWYSGPGAASPFGYGSGQDFHPPPFQRQQLPPFSRPRTFGFGRSFPMFRPVVAESNPSATCINDTPSVKDDWVDWKLLFPDRRWLPAEPVAITTGNKPSARTIKDGRDSGTEKHHNPTNIIGSKKTKSEAIASEPNSVRGLKGFEPSTGIKRSREKYDLFR